MHTGSYSDVSEICEDSDGSELSDNDKKSKKIMTHPRTRRERSAVTEMTTHTRTSKADLLWLHKKER